MKKKLCIFGSITIITLLLSGCGAKLIDGKEAVVSFKNNDGITTETFYDLLKDKYGTTELIDMVDEYLLEKEYDKSNSETKYINESIESIKSSAGENYDSYIKQYYGADSEEDLKDIIRLNYRRNLWITDYTEENVTEKELKTYYEEKAVGDMELSHILVTPDVESDATTEEKTAAEEKALEKAQSIIKELDNGADFAELAKKYSEDTANKNDGGSLGYINREGYDENFVEGAIDLEVGKYTTTPVKSAYGYHIILKSNQKEKSSLKDLEESMRTAIATEKLKTDSSLQLKAIEALREKYEMKINDSNLNSSYNTTMDNLYSSYKATSQEEE